MENKSILWHYNSVYESYKAGLMTEEEWKEYCTEMLFYLMQEHKDVFERLSKT